jgi:peptidoglycan/xylan/chitin deacetylase (PgdA/CDA1 family)
LRHSFTPFVSFLPIALALLLVHPTAAEPVALTFDDLPTLSLSDDLAFCEETTTRLLTGLKRHHLPATGFVNEGKLEGTDKTERIALLSQWLNAGMDLGNHSYSHVSLTKTPVEAYIADVQRGEAVTRPLLAARERTPYWFRHPYLETGTTLETRDTVEAWLANHGYRVAPVTMENADWMFAYPYDEAILNHDPATSVRIKGEYVAYTIAVISWYRAAALHLLGRRPAFVFLLHSSRLNADSIDSLAAILQSEDLNAVTLGTAMRDPAYDISDRYAGPNGDEWLTRWALTLHKELPWSSFPAPPANIDADERRLDTAP